MKILIFFLFVSLLSVSSVSSARLLPPKQDEKGMEKGDEIAQLSTSSVEMKEDFSTLTGSEACEDKDEECLKRREVAEAHLDYIYTQHHKNP